jgi:hypothetical protein
MRPTMATTAISSVISNPLADRARTATDSVIQAPECNDLVNICAANSTEMRRTPVRPDLKR